MTRILALFFAGLVLFQSFGRELLVVSYELNKAKITARFCENKALPQLGCNGKCHLAKQLRKTEGTGKKAPAGPAAKVKFEVLPAGAALTVAGLRHWPLPARGYAAQPGSIYADAPAAGVFRPPLLHV